MTVVPTLSKLSLTPGSASLFAGSTRQFAASGTDQFGTAIAQPAASWMVSSGPGSINDSGLCQAPITSGGAVITATVGSVSASAGVSILNRLPAPTGLAAATEEDDSAIDLSWTAPAGPVTGYFVYRGTAAGGESTTPLDGTPIAGTTFRDSAVSPGVTYDYDVAAVNDRGTSPASGEAAATTVPDSALIVLTASSDYRWTIADLNAYV